MCESRVNPLARRFGLAVALVALSLGVVGCGKSHSNGASPIQNTKEHPTVTVVGQIVDNNGIPVSGAQVFIPDGATNSGGLSGKSVTVHGRSVPAKASVTTDAAGQFTIANVVATNVANSTGSFTGHSPIPLQIVPPAGFVGATVEVSPMAQVVGDTPPGAAQGNPAVIFIDGFTASTGIIKIPALTTTVRGTLVSDTTGEPIPGADLDLDFRSPDFDNGVAGVVVQFAQGLITTMTAADGTFSFVGVADDSCFDLSSPGLDLTDASTFDPTGDCGTGSDFGFVLSTRTESAHSVVLGDVFADSFLTGDQTAPYVTRVAQVTNQQDAVGQLASNANGTGGLQISFSETVNVAANPTVLVTESNPSGVPTSFTVPATASFAGGILTVTTSSPLVPGDDVVVAILAQDVKDLAGNILAAPGSFTGSNPSEVNFDNTITGVPSGNYVDLALSAFAPAVTGLQAVTNLQQNSDPLNADGTFGACSDSVSLFVSSNAFLDASPDTLTGFGCAIAQLNTEVLDTPPLSFFGSTSVKNHLDDLGDALVGSSPTILTEQANLSFTTSGAVDYVVTLRDGSNQPVSLVSPDLVILPVGGTPPFTKGGLVALDPPFGNSAAFGIELDLPVGATPDSTTVVNFLLGPVQPGYTVAIVPRGSGDVVNSDVGSAATVVLQDNGRPTTGVQATQAAIAAASAAHSGSGGGPVSSVDTAGGEPIFPVTPLAFDRNVSATGSGSLYTDGNGEDLNGSLEPGGLSSPALLALGLTPLTFSNSIYDATGWAAFVPSNNLGISVTEPLSLTATQPPPAFTGTAALALVSVLTNVHSPADGSNDNDLYVISVDDVTKLETDGRSNSKDIDLTGIVDTSGLAANAGTNAKVQVRDVSPPFMTQAFRSADGKNLVFSFHEPVNPTAVLSLAPGNVIRFEDCGNDVSLNAAFDTTLNSGVNAATLTNGGKTITIPRTNSAAGSIDNTCFTTGAYAESVYSSGTASVNHGIVRWEVPDTADNSDIGLGDAVGANDWAYWTGLFATTLAEPAPEFAAADLLGPFEPTLVSRSTNFGSAASGGFTVGAIGDIVTVDITFSQPFVFPTGGMMDNFGDSGSATASPSAAEVLAFAQAKFELFDSTAATTIMPTGAVVIRDQNGLSITAAGADPTSAITVHLEFVLGSAVAAADQIRIISGEGLQSAFDPTTTHIYPYDEGADGTQTAGDGVNSRNELFSIRPGPATFACPQTMTNGAVEGSQC